MSFLRDFLSLLWAYSPRQTLVLGALTLLTGLTDGIGLILLIPVLKLIEARASGTTASTLSNIPDWMAPLANPWALIALFALLIGTRTLIVWRKTVLSSALQLGLARNLRRNCYDGLLGSDWRWISQQRSGDHAGMIFQQVQRTTAGVNTSISLVTAGVLAAVYLCVALTVSFPMTLLALGLAVLVLFVLRRQLATSRRLGQSLNQSNKDVHTAVQEGLAGLRQTKISGQEIAQSETFAQKLETQNQILQAFVHTNAFAAAVFQSAIAVLLCALIYLGVVVFALPFASLILLVIILARIAPLALRIQTLLNQTINAAPALKDVQTFLATTTPFDAASTPPSPLFLNHEIRLESVSLAYTDTPALDAVSATISARKITVIKGPSGAGKSTLADLLIGLLEPDSGTIHIDQTPLDRTTRPAWRQSVAYVPQDPFLFHGTILENLLWAVPTASQAEIDAALNLASAGFVDEFPQKRDTLVGDDGQRLSGGEKQRIALARAVLSKPALLILDEATNALDPHTRAAVEAALSSLKSQMTLVVITHADSGFSGSDQIISLRSGKII